jgi:hypothetical protein
MPRSIVTQSAQHCLPERETVTLTAAEIAQVMRPRALITPGLLNTRTAGGWGDGPGEPEFDIRNSAPGMGHLEAPPGGHGMTHEDFDDGDGGPGWDMDEYDDMRDQSRQQRYVDQWNPENDAFDPRHLGK